MTTITGETRDRITVRHIPVQTNLERYSFLFMRLSGVGLLVLAVGHMVIQHILNGSATLSIQFVAAQWSSWGWKAYDILLLWLAIPHGFNGLRYVLGDYIHNRATMRAINAVLAIVVVATVIWATIGMILFDPAPFQ
jgi:succinate dehydrogenase / fumarate reductase membrane anchor subunit